LMKNRDCGLLKRSRGEAREKSASADVLAQYVDTRRFERNEAYGSFSAAC
jgi:hypothetical protein